MTVSSYDAGGGIYNAGSTRLNHTAISNNIALQDFGSTTPAMGGGICNTGDLTIKRSTITHNTATVTPSSVLGVAEAEGCGIFSGQIFVYSGGTLKMRQSVVSDNRVRFNGPSATVAGGGIAVGTGGTATLDESIIRENIARISSGIAAGNPLAAAAGIYVEGTAILRHTLVFSNRTETSTPPSGAGTGAGGGVAIGVNAFGENANGKLTLLHTDVRCNFVGAPAQAFGGGIDNGATSMATLEHSEVQENTAVAATLADSLGGGIYNANTTAGSVALSDTGVKHNHPDNCDPSGSVPGCVN